MQNNRLEPVDSVQLLHEIAENSDVQEFFSRYLNQPFDVVSFETRMKEINQKALEIYPYRCVQTYSYLTTRMMKNPFYSSVVKDINTKFILDVGCCVGSDMRRLILDGAQSDYMLGVDLEGDFFKIGFEIFQDQSKLPKNIFLQADIFEENFIEKIQGEMKMRKLHNNRIFQGFDLIQLGAVIHLLTEEKIEFLLKLIYERLLKEGGSLVGQTIGTIATNGGGVGDLNKFLHSKDSLTSVMSRVGFVNISIQESDSHWPLFKSTLDGSRVLLYFRADK